MSDNMKRILRVLLEGERAQDWSGFGQTANEIGAKLDLPRVRRVHGPWSGFMGPAQRIIVPLTALRRRGLVDFGRRPDGRSGTAYRLTDAGRAAAREL